MSLGGLRRGGAAVACVCIAVLVACSFPFSAASAPHEAPLVATGDDRGPDHLFVVTVDGSVHYVDIETGEVQWTTHSTMALGSNDTLGAHASLGPLWSTRWRAASHRDDSSEDESALDVKPDLVPGLDGSLYLYVPGEGLTRLPVTVQKIAERSPLEAGDGYVYVGVKHASVAAICGESGANLRRVSHRADHSTDSTLIGEDTITLDESEEVGQGRKSDGEDPFTVGHVVYSVRAVDVRSGAELWNVSLSELRAISTSHTRRNDQLPSPHVSPYELASLPDGTLYALDRETGIPAWTATLSGAVVKAMGVTGGRADREVTARVFASTDALAETIQSSTAWTNDPMTATTPTVLVSRGTKSVFALEMSSGSGAGGPRAALGAPSRSARNETTIAGLATASPQSTSHAHHHQSDRDRESVCALRPGLLQAGGEDSCLLGVHTVANANSDVVGEEYVGEVSDDDDDENGEDADADPIVVGVLDEIEGLWGWISPSMAFTAIALYSLVLVGAVLALLRFRGVRAPEPDRSDSVSESSASAAAWSRGWYPPADASFPWGEPVACVPGATGPSRVGRLALSGRVLGRGSHGTVVLDGSLDGRPVAVKRILASLGGIAARELQLLIESDRHPNVVRYFARENAGEFVYLALERCDTTLAEVVESARLTSFVADRGAVVLSAKALRIAHELVEGLRHLHSLNIVHRDIKPQNILLTSDMRVRLSDMGLARRLDSDRSSFSTLACGTYGWRAREVLQGTGSLTRAIDIFSAGCVLYYTFTGGKHPFGERYLREANILQGRCSLAELERIPEACDLVRRMIHKHPDRRPKIEEVAAHPVFWSIERRAAFLADVSDVIEFARSSAALTEKRRAASAQAATGPMPIYERYERNRAAVFTGKNWKSCLHICVLDFLHAQRGYRAESLGDLLRAFRNTRAHVASAPAEVLAELGISDSSAPTATQVYLYWIARFPNFFMYTYRVARAFASQFEALSPHFFDALPHTHDV